MTSLTPFRRKTRKYTFVTSTNLQNQLAYVWDAVNRAIFIVIILFVFVQLWSAVYARQDDGEIAGLTLSMTIWYFLIAEVMELSRVRHDMTISQEVKDGTVAYTMLRPYNYLAYHFFNGLGEVVFKMILIFLLGVPVVLFYAGLPSINPLHLLPLGLIVLMAVVLDFMIFSIIGLLAFVVEDVGAYRLIYQKLVFVLGGLLIPLDFLPDRLQMVARVLPFNLTTYAPAKLFVDFDWGDFGRFLALQLIWIAIIGSALVLQYRWATRRLELNGG